MLTSFEIIRDLDLRGLADDELSTVIKGFQEEQKKRQEVVKAKDWDILAKCIKEYCQKYNSINICGDIFVDENDDFSKPGEIW